MPTRILSVFDDLNYDRSDYDGLSPGMRGYATKELGKLGFNQKSGRCLHT